MIFIGFNRYIFRIWTNGIKRSLSSVLTASIIFTHIRSRFVVVLLQYRGVISVIVTKLATATVTFSYCSRVAAAGCSSSGNAPGRQRLAAVEVQQ